MPEGLNIAYYTSISGEELNPYRRLNANCVKSHLNGYKPFKAVIHKNIPVRSIGIEIMPAYYEDYLQRLYPGEYASPYDAFLEVDETTDFPEMVKLLHQNGYVQGYEPPRILADILTKGQEPEREYLFTDIKIKTKYNL